MFWKFPESVKCARLRLAHLTNSGNFQNINTPAEPLPGHPALEIKAMSELSALGEASKKKPFFWEIFSKCGWVGWLIPKQGPTPSKTPQITAKIAFFDPNFTFCFPKSRKNPWVGEWVSTFGKDLQKKFFFLDAFPYTTECEPFPII